MIRFAIWVPEAERVEVEVAHARHPMVLEGKRGWWVADIDVAGETDAMPSEVDYAFRIDGGDPLPDPRSRRQPDGPAGPSRTWDPDGFEWTDGAWRGAPLAGAVVYELHVGAFTPEGTLDAAIGKLGYLRDLGVTTIELMPVASFPGSHGWGYDGIGLYAVHEPYGGPDALMRFVDAAHGMGLAVLLDVVYNHLGPGNRIGDFGPYFTDAYPTPWGSAVNLDQAGSDEVRAFIVDNALMWLRVFHMDGLRLDAVHALEDRRAEHILESLASAVDALEASTGWSRVLIAESDLNNPRLITSRESGGYGLDGQWNDDFHHCVHAALTGERQGYYGDFGSMAALAKVFTGAYFHDGTWSSFRGRCHGRPVDTFTVPSHRFVVFSQDHDQVGNRATGDRLTAILPGSRDRDGLLKVAAGLVLLSPFTPMLFMGEEWGAGTPFQYFTDHTDPFFANAVSEGRRSEFASHGWSFDDVPDPQDPATFQRSKLDWSQPDREPHKSLLEWYRDLLTLRRSRPELTDPRLHLVRVDYDEAARWIVIHRGSVHVAANLGDAPATLPLAAATPLLSSTPDITVHPDSVTIPAAGFFVAADNCPPAPRELRSGRFPGEVVGMAVRFPDEPGFQGRFAPVRMEGEIRGLEVIQGEVPAHLHGTYYRVGADPAWPPAPGVERDFYFNADGIVSMFRFGGGHVDFKTRYVRTPRFLAEREARRSLFGAYRNPHTDDPSVAGLSRGLANTNVYWHAGRLLASKEDSPPVQIDPDTLETVGEWTWKGDLSSKTATAHPKIDPRDGSLVFFGYAAKGETTPDIAYYEADSSGRIVHEAWFTAPYASMIHDWAVTENFVIFPIIPLTSDAERLKAGGPYYVWDGSQDVYLGVVPRRGTGVQWFRGTNRFASHIMNAFDDGRHIYIDTPVGEKSAFPWFPDIDGAPFDPEKSKGYLSRWTVDTRGNPDEGFEESRLTFCPGEFPRTDERWATSEYRFGVINLTEVPDRPVDDGLPGFRWLASIDPETGQMRTRFAGRDSTVQEAVFVPGAPSAGHGDGYVLQLVDRHESASTELLVLDAQHIDDLPVATLRIPIRMPGGLHGNWVTEQQLRSPARV